MSQSVWATSKASKRSRGQAQRWNPTTLLEEPKSKKMRVPDQDENDETRRETMTRNGLQSFSGALARRTPSSVPRPVISEFAILPTQPRPALDFYADSLYDPCLRRSPGPSCVSIEHALSKLKKDPILNQYLDHLYPTRSEKGETAIEIYSNLIRLQEGFSAIGSLAQHEWKFRALIIAFGLLTRQVCESEKGARTFTSASEYLRVVLGLGSRSLPRPWRAFLRNDGKVILIRYKDNDKFDYSSSHMVRWNSGGKATSCADMKRSGKAKMRISHTMRQFGSVFWEGVGSLALRMPEVDDIGTQVGFMCNVLMDTLVLGSHCMDDRLFHRWSQDTSFRLSCLIFYTGDIVGRSRYGFDVWAPFIPFQEHNTKNVVTM